MPQLPTADWKDHQGADASLANTRKGMGYVNIDLFGPMPNKKHVLVVQDQTSRFLQFS